MFLTTFLRKLMLLTNYSIMCYNRVEVSKKGEFNMIFLGIVFILLIYGFGLYNSLVRLNNVVREAFATMDVYLKKRWDLIPNLVNVVKGYAKHEQDTLKEVVELRNVAYPSMSNDKKIEVNEQLTNGISKIIALCESYPDLKANENFRDLSAQLTAIESDIANSRKYYNGAVRMFNNKVQMFPNNIFAKLFGFSVITMFEINSTERDNVNVEF